MARQAKNIDQLKTQILVQAREDSAKILAIFRNAFQTSGVGVATAAWDAGNPNPDPRATKDPSGIPNAARALSGAANNVRLTPGDLGYSGSIEFWHVATLDTDTLPAADNSIPVWPMMNWGSGSRWRVSSGIIPDGRAISRTYGNRTARLRTPNVGRSRSRPPSDRSEPQFSWFSMSDIGDRGVGIYVPTPRAERMLRFAQKKPNSKLGKANPTIQPFFEFAPTFFVEQSIGATLQRVTQFLGQQRFRPSTG
jgi:hypothetical protein